LHQGWQFGKNGWWITLCCRWFADCQGYLSLRHRISCERVHDQQDILALVSKVFGNCGRVCCTLQPHQRWRVGRRCDDDRTFHAFSTKDLLNKLLDLSAALADE